MLKMSDEEFRELFIKDGEKIIEDTIVIIAGDNNLSLDQLKKSIEIGVEAAFFKIKQVYGEEYKRRKGFDIEDSIEKRKDLSQELLLGILHERMKDGDFSFMTDPRNRVENAPK